MRHAIAVHVYFSTPRPTHLKPAFNGAIRSRPATPGCCRQAQSAFDLVTSFSAGVRGTVWVASPSFFFLPRSSGRKSFSMPM